MKWATGMLLGAGLLLAGCAGVPLPSLAGGTTPAPVATTTATGAKVAAVVSNVQKYTRTFCQFEPTFASVVGIINAGAGDVAQVLGGAICNAVTTNPLAEGDTPGYYKAMTVHGVAVQGRFVKPKR